MAERTATGRLRRLLALVPYVLAHQGIALRDVAETFEVTERELMDDLDLLFVCGLPGYSHLELIDVSYESGHIYIRNADVISAPMRLHRDEALTLAIGLQLLEQVETRGEREAIADLRARILAAATEALDVTRIAVVPEVDSSVGATVAEALQRRRRLLIDYFVPSRDEVTSREIDPIAITSIDGEKYLRAWCRSAEALRHFRIDRIEGAKIIDRPAAPPENAVSEASGAFQAPADAERATLRIGSSARWLIDFLEAEILEATIDTTLITITVGDPDRIAALVLQSGEAVEVVAPTSLRDLVRSRAAEALALYA